MVKAWVIGAGITGLNAAREFSARGIPVTIFEQSQRLGGLAGYVEKFDRHLDLGPHIFHSPDPEIVSYLNKSFPANFTSDATGRKIIRLENYTTTRSLRSS